MFLLYNVYYLLYINNNIIIIISKRLYSVEWSISEMKTNNFKFKNIYVGEEDKQNELEEPLKDYISWQKAKQKKNGRKMDQVYILFNT